MHPLKEQMIMDLQLRGCSFKTQESYLGTMKFFTRYFGKSPTDLGEAEIKQYLHYLITEKKASRSTVICAYSALKFFYKNTLHREWEIENIPRMKKEKKLPMILDVSEIEQLLQHTKNLKHRTILATTYSAGLRVSETANLKITDIDSKRMQIIVRGGKGKKDRRTILSEKNLKILREYWLAYRPHDWLFPGLLPERPLTSNAIEDIFDKARLRAKINKPLSLHSLRHSFATHLLEAGVDIFYVKELLGHSSIKTTTIYLHLCNQRAFKIKSPLDLLSELQL